MESDQHERMTELRTLGIPPQPPGKVWTFQAFTNSLTGSEITLIATQEVENLVMSLLMSIIPSPSIHTRIHFIQYGN